MSQIIPEEKTLLDPGWRGEQLGQCREPAKKAPEEPVTFTAPEHLPWASLLPLSLCQAKLGTWSSSASGKQCRIYGIFSSFVSVRDTSPGWTHSQWCSGLSPCPCSVPRD